MPIGLSWNGFFAGVIRAVVATWCNFSICNCVRTRQDNDNWEGAGAVLVGKETGEFWELERYKGIRWRCSGTGGFAVLAFWMNRLTYVEPLVCSHL